MSNKPKTKPLFTDVPADFVKSCLTPFQKITICEHYQIYTYVQAYDGRKSEAFYDLSDTMGRTNEHIKNVYYQTVRRLGKNKYD